MAPELERASVAWLGASRVGLVPTADAPLLAQVVRARREALGLSQAEVAQAAGISQAYLSRIESGQRKALQADTRKALAVALDLPDGRVGLQTGRAVIGSRGSDPLLPAVLDLARVARESGHSRQAAAGARLVADSLPTLRDLDSSLAATLAEAQLIEGVCLGDFDQTRASATAIARLKSAHTIATGAGAGRVAHEAALKLGNELRKAQRTMEGLDWLRRAVLDAPSSGAQQTARVALVRALGAARQLDGLRDEVDALRQVEDHPEVWTPTLHPLIATEVEARALMALSRPLSGALVGRLRAVGSESLAPQWRAIISLTYGEALMARGEDDQALASLEAGLAYAVRFELPRQRQRGLRLLDRNRSGDAVVVGERVRNSPLL